MRYIIDFLPLLAGIGLFLYGMKILGVALEKLAGASLENILKKLTSNRISALLLGTGVTGVIQSSSATIIMVIGLLNAGILTLSQGLPVMMGANIGTTVTAHILRLGDLGGAAVFLQLLKPSAFGAILMAVGACIIMFCKKSSILNWGNICLGLGMIFFGMNTMEKTMAPLGQMEWFQSLLGTLSNPFLGIAVGIAMTAILQSSSASVGILQALAATGTISWSIAIPVVLGQNLGKCITVIIGSIGSKRTAKRAIMLDVMMNATGLIVFCAVIYTLVGFGVIPFFEEAVNRGNIADFHTIFNLATALILLPFTTLLTKLAYKILPDKQESDALESLKALDPLLIKTPAVALQSAKTVVTTMAEEALKSFRYSTNTLLSYNEKDFSALNECERFLDKAEVELNSYITKITAKELSEKDSKHATEILHSVGDFERIGDHAVNLAEAAKYNFDNKIKFSDEGLSQLTVMLNAVDEVLDKTVDMYTTEALDNCSDINSLEWAVDDLEIELRDKHINRMQLGICSPNSTISYTKILTDLERISDHCCNVAIHMYSAKHNLNREDTEKEIRSLSDSNVQKYKSKYTI